MTFSLWNLISIVSAVKILPRNSTCHHDHTGSELLNARRWFYTLCTHADDLIPVRLRCSFFPVICQRQQMINSSRVIHYVPHSRMWSVPRIVVPSNPVFAGLHPECQFSFHTADLGSRPFWSSSWDVVRSEGDYIPYGSLTWLWAYGKSPREWKKLHFQMLATPSNIFYRWF